MKNLVVFSDFDGTITKEDTLNKFLHIYADSKWLEIENRWINNEIGSKECIEEQMKLVSVPEQEKMDKFIESIEIDETFPDFYNYLRKENIALVHSHGKGAGMYARPLKWFCPRLRVVHTFHGIYLEQYGTALRYIYCWIERILRRSTDAFICVSESERKEALRLRFADPKKTSVICNGIEVEIFQNAESNRMKYLKEFGFAEDGWLIGCVARLEKMKGHVCLLRGFQRLLSKIPDGRLILAGDGPDRNLVEQEIQKLGLGQKVKILGFRRDIPELLKTFDVFVSASLKEGMPYTLIEALAAGVPVVATDVIGNKDVIVNEQCGFLVPPENPQKLAEALEMLHDNPEWGERFKNEGMRRVKSRFTAEGAVRKLFDVYGELI